MKKFNPIPKTSILYFVTFIVVLSLALSVCTENVDAVPPQPRSATHKTESQPSGSFFGAFHHPSKETTTGKQTSQPKSGGVHRSKEVVTSKEEKASKPWKPFDKLFGGFVKKDTPENTKKIKVPAGGEKKSSGDAAVASDSESKGSAKGQKISRDKLPKDIPSDAVILSDSKVSDDGVLEEAEESPETVQNLVKEAENSSASKTAKGEDEENPNLILEPDDSIVNSINEEITSSINSEEKNEENEEEKSEENELDNWNQTVPDLDFIETQKPEPTLNVSPQRLTSPAEATDTVSHTPATNTLRSLSAAPGSSKVQIGSRVGKQVALPKKEDQAELRIFTRIPENLLTGVKNQLEIEVENPSKATSEKSTVEVQIPIWMQVLKMESEKGIVKIVPGENSEDQRCTWFVGDLKPGAREKMVLQVVPQRKNAANIAVSWSNQQVSSNQTIVSEDPEIRMEILGPSSVLEGKETKVSIQVSNTGKCGVSDLNLVCSAEGCQSQKYFVPGIPYIGPGEKKVVDLSIKPASREKMKIHVDAMIQNQTFSQSNLEITVNYTDLQIRIQNPETCFVGINKKIPVEIYNSGNVPLEGCSLCVELPPQLEFAGESLGAFQQDSASGLMMMDMMPLPAGAAKTYTLDLKIKEEGNPEIPLGILANSRTIAQARIPLQIEGVANVQMELNVPSGALTALEPGTYEIRLVNTGTQKIDDGKLYVFFSEGFEPQATFNGGKILEGGIVMFDVMPLVPGESHTFQIQAQVNERGNYPIRCQLKSEKYHLDLLQQGTAIFR